MMTRSGRFSNTPRIVSKKTLDRKVEIQEAADRQRQEIENQPVIIRVLVDKADVQENQYNIEDRNQPHRCFLIRLKMRELYENHIEPACQKDGEHDIKTRSTTS